MRRVRNIDDVRAIAKRRLPRVAFDFIDGGAEDEITLRANRNAFQELALRPRWLQDVSPPREQSVTVFGRRLEMPVLLAPTGFARLAHRIAEVAAARAAIKHGTIFTLTSNSSMSIEQVMQGAPGEHWFQLYFWRSRERNEELIDRARSMGYTALVVTVDVPVIGKRERDLRNGFTVPLRPRLSTALDVARHPRWIADYVRGGPITFANFVEMGKGRKATELFKYVNTELAHPGATFEDLRWLREVWEGPLLIKGTLTAEEAEESIACGVDGIVVSNHGGRQLDGVQATIDALPEVVNAARGRVDVFLDGGVRRGTDVVKALCLGARAVLVGRPYLYGAAMAGEAGVSRVLEIFKDEIDLTLALIGRRSVAELDRSCVTRMRPGEAVSRFDAEAPDSLERARDD